MFDKIVGTFMITLCVVNCIPQQGRSISAGSQRYSENLSNLLNLRGPFATKEPTVDDVTLDIAQELFSHKDLVEEFVSCFDLFHDCQYAGFNIFINQIGLDIDINNNCARCSNEFREVVEFARRKFQNEYRVTWKRFIPLLSEHLGGL